MKLHKIVVFFIIFLIFIFGCQEKSDKRDIVQNGTEENRSTSENSPQILTLNGVNFINSESDKVIWELNSEMAKIDKKDKIADLKGVNIIFHQQELKILSNKAIYDISSHNGTIYDNVTILGRGWKIESQKATLINKSNQIKIETPFIFYGENFYLSGSKMDGFIDNRKIIVYGRVRSVWGEK